jgi:predicted nucleic acid-binding protein
VIRLVLDASILLSAAVAKPESHPSLLLDAVRSGEIEMVACPKLLSEVRAGLAGRYFRDRITDEERTVIPAMLAALGVILPDPVLSARAACRLLGLIAP